MIDYNDFANQIRAQYPEYKGMGNYELAKLMIKKYPVYKDQVSFAEKTQKGASVAAPNFAADNALYLASEEEKKRLVEFKKNQDRIKAEKKAEAAAAIAAEEARMQEVWKQQIIKAREQASKTPPPSLTMSGKPASKQPLGDNNRYDFTSPDLVADALITTEEKEKQRETVFKQAEADALVETKAKEQALQIWKDGLTIKESENYEKISNIGLDLMSNYEENSVPELNKRFAGSGIYFEETGFGDQIRVISSIDDKFSSVNEEIFQLYPKTYGGFQNSELIYDEEGAKKELERLQGFISDSFLNKSEKDFLNKKGLTMENMIKLKADNPRKYGESFLKN